MIREGEGTKELFVPGTVHIYFAGGVLDGVIESHKDPAYVLRIQIDEWSEHVYRMARVELDHEKDGPYRGHKGVWRFTGVNYLEEDSDGTT